MTDEPTYEYIKGHGWVVSTYETITGVIGIYHVTLVKRTPEIGELFWSDDCPLSETFNNLQQRTYDFTGQVRFNKWDGKPNYFGIPSVTMLLKLVDSDVEVG